MKKTIIIIAGLVLSFSFGFCVNAILLKHTLAEETKQQQTTQRVTGVAGIFFKAQDPKKLKAWYKAHLGFDTNAYGTRFEWQEGADTTKKGSLQWCPFNDKTTYFAPSTKDFMINYRVEDLTGLVKQLKEEGVTMVDTIETYDYGKFVHIMDLEGNKIELYQPNYAHKAAK